jgi:ATPase subunit of ABC transporter with duplicated ATPase domains
MKTKALLILTASIVTLQARTERDYDLDWYGRQNAERNAQRRHEEDQRERGYQEQQEWINRIQRDSAAKKAQQAADRAAAENARQLRDIQEKLERLERNKP